MGGINEPFDSIMEHEAAIPSIDYAHRQRLKRRGKEKDYVLEEYETYGQRKGFVRVVTTTQAPAASQPPKAQHQGHYSIQSRCFEHHIEPDTLDIDVDLRPTHQRQQPAHTVHTEQMDEERKEATDVVAASRHGGAERLKPKEKRTAQSFGRKSDFFNSAIAMKRQHTIEETQRRERSSSFKPLPPEDGVQVMQSMSASPAVIGVVPKEPQVMSTKQYSRHMRTMEEKDAVVTDDEAAAESVAAKRAKFQRMSVVQKQAH